MSGLPNFERDENHEWRVNERVYVLEENEFDIFEAIITAVYEDGYDVHYPEWEDDDTTVTADRLIAITARNRAIFEEQEKIRAGKEEDDDFIDDDDDDKPSKKKRKAPKEPKPKKEKKPKEPKPKKEKKPKEPKPKKEKTPSEKKKAKPSKNLSDDMILRKALVGVKLIDEFDAWFDKHYAGEPSVQDRKEAIKDRFIARKSATADSFVAADDDFGNDIGHFSSDYSASDNPEEEISYNNPEILKLRPQRQERVDGTCLRFPGSLSFAHPEEDEVKEMDMRIMFDEDDYANCFIYKTAKEEFLIINGMKWRIKHDKDMYIDQSELFEESPVINIENPQTTAALYPALHIVDPVQLVQPPEYDEYLMLVQKEKKKVQIGSMADVAPINSGTVSDRKSRTTQKKVDLSNLESDSSDD